MSNKIPTVDKFFEEEFKLAQEAMPAIWYDIKLKILEYTQLHVEAALKAAAEKACVEFSKRTRTYSENNKRFVVNGGDVYTVSKHSILDAYPKENIQ